MILEKSQNNLSLSANVYNFYIVYDISVLSYGLSTLSITKFPINDPSCYGQFTKLYLPSIFTKNLFISLSLVLGLLISVV